MNIHKLSMNLTSISSTQWIHCKWSDSLWIYCKFTSVCRIKIIRARSLYIGLSFPGPHILSGRIVFNSHHMFVKNEYSRTVNEFNINSQHTINLLQMLRLFGNLLQIHFCPQNQNSVRENLFKFPAHICKKWIFTNCQWI